jgi:hypothetical protein
MHVKHAAPTFIGAKENSGVHLTERVSNESVLPKKINATKPQAGNIQIKQNELGLITDIWDANGNRFQYRYQTFTYASPLTPDLPSYAGSYLKEVEAPGGAITKYNAEIVQQTDTFTPLDDPMAERSTYWFFNLTSITDPENRVHNFVYETDVAKWLYRWNWNSEVGYFRQFPAPRSIRSAQNAAGTAIFDNQSDVRLSFSGETPAMVGHAPKDGHSR